MSDTSNDTRTDAERARDEGMAALDRAEQAVEARADTARGRGADAGAKLGTLLASARGVIERLRQRIRNR